VWESVAGEGNEQMAMGGVTVGNWTGMVGTGAESRKQLMHRAGLGVIGYIRRNEGRQE
jgi:hypothetical protein